ncbi:MAG: PQQ-binding-like beta-propeller repeat protein [Acidimicrobiia bacterium]|nr:PQQ-binding-like beta-propeller repeat protein [Acidimicrobiia bacterium]
MARRTLVPSVAVALAVVATGCQLLPSEPTPSTTLAAEEPDPTTMAVPATTPTTPAFEPFEGVTVEADGGTTVIDFPSGECTSVTASPIVVGDLLVWPWHERGHGCEGRMVDSAVLVGYSMTTGDVYRLAEGASGEATLTYDASHGVVWWTTTFGSTARILDAETFETVAVVDLGVGSDSAGAVVGDHLVFGTVNTPEAGCQEPVDPACGGVYAVDASGAIQATLDLAAGFRSWIGASVTTDGETLYVGGGPAHVGSDEPSDTYGCSVVRLDTDLNVLAAADPGDPGCHRTGAAQNDEDAVAGEPVLGPDSVWVQFTHATDGRNQATVVRYDRDLVEQCRAEVFGGPIQVAAYYAAPTVDAEGNAYVPFTLPDGPGGGVVATILEVTPECEVTTLAEVPGSRALASPTLADDDVLFATTGRLDVLTLTGDPVASYPLGSDAEVMASPVVHDGTVYVLSADGTLTVIEDTGLSGYGDAFWPRYRHDDAGTGRAD